MDDNTKTAKEPDEAVENPPEEPAAAEQSEDEKADIVIDENDWDKKEEPKADPDPGTSGKPKSKWQEWKEKTTLHWPPGKREYITAAVLVLVIGVGIVAWILTHNTPATLRPIPKITDITKTVPSTLTGLPVDPIVNERTVTGVMIENSVWARPQAGLGQAGVVFEAIAEAGITRFLALYQDTAPGNVGPIRSARPYFVRWVQGFDAGLAHVGGSPEALANIKAWHVRDLDQFWAADYYHRITSRAAPHNVYTSIHALNKLEVNRGYKTSKYTGFVRKKKAFRKKSQPITARTIRLMLSGPTYDVSYKYNDKTDSYFRSEGGAKHIDSNNGKQIKPVVVIAMVIPYSLEADGYHSNYNNLGKGKAFIFQDGGVIKAFWSKSKNTSQIKFTDAKGKAVQLNPGQTWITAMSAANKVIYAP